MIRQKNKIINLQDDFYHNKKIEKGKRIILKGTKIISILIILVALALVVGRSIEFVKKTSMFNINNLIINGNVYLTFNDIIEIIDIKSGDNIFHVQLREMKNKLELHPRVKSVSLKKELPDKIIININERKPLALLNAQKDINYCLYEIDSEGYIIGEYPHLLTYDLPVITGYLFKNIIPGEKLNNEFFLNILAILSKIENKYYNFKRFIAEINIKKGFKNPSIIIYLNHFNTKVRFGESFTEDKINKLNSLLMVIGDKIYDLEYIDFKHNEAVGKYKI